MIIALTIMMYLMLVVLLVLIHEHEKMKTRVKQLETLHLKTINIFNDRTSCQANALKLFSNLLKDHLVNSKIDSIRLNRHEQAIGFLNLNHEKLEAGHELICDTIGKDRVAQGVINGDFYVLLINLKKSLGFQYNPRLEKILSEITDQVNLHNEISDIEHGSLDTPENGDPEGQKP